MECPTKHKYIAGKLSLCIGLPVMLRHNNATELCITKGQEGVVVGWESSIGKHGCLTLETLFVELINPPKNINLEGLPKNVVPISKSTTAVTCRLPDDSIISIKRQQVVVLPNFSMTDYTAHTAGIGLFALR